MTRDKERHATGLNATVTKDGVTYHCLVDDISEGGLGLCSTVLIAKLHVGDSVDCLVQLPDGEVKCSGTITWIKPQHGTTGMAVSSFEEGESLLRDYAGLPW